MNHRPRVEDVEAIDIETGPIAFTSAGIKAPRIGVQGKFSLWFLAALALAEGNVTVDKFTDEKIGDPRLVTLRKKVNANMVRERKLGAKVSVKMNDGQVFEGILKNPKGSPENPLGFEAIARKFESTARLAIAHENIDPLMERIAHFETLACVDEIFSLAKEKRSP